MAWRTQIDTVHGPRLTITESHTSDNVLLSIADSTDSTYTEWKVVSSYVLGTKEALAMANALQQIVKLNKARS